MRKRIALLLVLAVLACLLSSCTLFQSDFTFINNSSHSLTISPNGQSGWSEFLLSPGSERVVTISQNEIYFFYNYAGVVDCDTSAHKGEIIFTDKP